MLFPPEELLPGPSQDDEESTCTECSTCADRCASRSCNVRTTAAGGLSGLYHGINVKKTAMSHAQDSPCKRSTSYTHTSWSQTQAAVERSD